MDCAGEGIGGGVVIKQINNAAYLSKYRQAGGKYYCAKNMQNGFDHVSFLLRAALLHPTRQ